MIYIFDLDYTLLDTVKFENNLPAVLGVSKDDFDDTYEKYYRRGQNPYNVYEHISFLAKEKKIKDRDQAKKNVLAMLKKLDEFIRPGTAGLLRRLKEKGQELILVTFGDLVWQKMKVKNLHIRKYFKRIIITDKDKVGTMEFLKNVKEKILIINDNARECVKFQEMLGKKVKIYLIKGPYSKNIKHNMKEYSLRELFGVL